MKNPNFFLVKSGKPSGPFSLEDLKKLGLRANDFIKREGEEDFYEVHESQELSRLLSISYQGTPPQYFATLDTRLLAWAIDMFLSFAVYCIFVLLPVIAFSEQDQRLVRILFSLLTILPIQILSGLFLESSRHQASLGKMFLRIKVTDLQGHRLSFSRSLLRTIGKIMGYLSLGVGFFIGFLDKKQRCLHDYIAGTLVVKDRLTN